MQLLPVATSNHDNHNGNN